MMMQLFFFLLVMVFAYLNYQFAKSYWCHEGMWGSDAHEQ